MSEVLVSNTVDAAADLPTGWVNPHSLSESFSYPAKEVD